MSKKPTNPTIHVLQRLEAKVDALDSRLDSVDKTLVKQEGNLGEHMRRTEIAERNIETVQRQASAAIESIRTEIKPLQNHKAFIEGAIKGIGLVATAASLIFGAVKAISAILSFLS